MPMLQKKTLILLVFCLGCAQVCYMIFINSWNRIEVRYSKHSNRSYIEKLVRIVPAWVVNPSTVENWTMLTDLEPGVGLDELIAGLAIQTCQENDTFAVALIVSTAGNRRERTVARETWAGQDVGHRLRIVTVFVMGYPSDNASMAAVQHEYVKHGDILLGNYTDSTRSYALNTLLGLKWATTLCPTAKFVILGNDRLIFMFWVLVHHLRTLTEDEADNAWLGKLKRHSKMGGFTTTPGDTFPAMCESEAGYVLGMSSARRVLNVAERLPNIPIYDEFLAIVANKSSISLINDDRFNPQDTNKQAVCAVSNAFTILVENPSALTPDVWKKLQNVKLRRECTNPDLDAVIRTDVNNTHVIQDALTPVIEHPGFCFEPSGDATNIFLIVLISTHPRNLQRRRLIRDTWGAQRSVLGENIRVLFLMGSTSEEPLQAKVKQENEDYGDIVQVRLMESFRNLTMKVVFGLQWVTNNCRHARYMYKGDDDMFVNFARIISFLKSSPESTSKYFVGSRLIGSPRITNSNSRYYVSDELFKGHYYPPYCSGGGYLMSTDIVPKLYKMADSTQFIPIDDAYQGILLKRIGVMPSSNPGFKNWGGHTDPCSLQKSMVVHFHTAKDKEKLSMVWQNFTKSASMNCQ